MFSRTSKGLVLALSLAATTFAVGCAGQADEDVASDEGAATAGAALAHDYEGTIGTHKVLLRLDAQGANVTGSYFYADKVGNGDSLILKGSTQGAKITLTESVNGQGATTGTFNGTVSANGISGTWKAGSTTLPLNLTAIKSFKTATRKFKAEIKAVKEPGQEWEPRDCSLEGEAIEIYGLDAKAEKAMMEKLVVEPLDRDEKGHCDGDIRWVTQSIKYNGNGFLTVHVATEWMGGAHPENGSEYYNFQVSTGAHIGPNEIFAAGSEAKVKELMIKQMNADPSLTEEEKKDTIESFEMHFTDETKLEHIQMGVGEKGLTIDMGNNYPHVILAIAPLLDIPWSDIKPLAKPGSPIAAMFK